MSQLIDQLGAALPDDETAHQIIAEVAELEKKLATFRHSNDVVSVALDKLCRDAGRERADYIVEAKQTVGDYPNYFAQTDENAAEGSDDSATTTA